jgi:hypothetical protein
MREICSHGKASSENIHGAAGLSDASLSRISGNLVMPCDSALAVWEYILG